MTPLNDAEGKNSGAGGEMEDLEAFLAKKAQMENLFQEKFTKTLTVMFTDLKGSTTIAEREGDLSSRMLIKHHNDIVFPIIKNNNGTLVKTIGDGTLSYFESAQDGVRAGTQIQKSVNEFNLSRKNRTPIQIRIGIHTGKVVFEKNDIFGDVVNTASRYESSANPGEVYISEETYNALSDKAEIYCRLIKTATLKGEERRRQHLQGILEQGRD
jgi:class 3 adenylate cyclase